MASCRHYATGHILITTWNCDASVMELTTRDRLDAVGDDFTCLKGKPHAFVMSTGANGHLMSPYLVHPL